MRPNGQLGIWYLAIGIYLLIGRLVLSVGVEPTIPGETVSETAAFACFATRVKKSVESQGIEPCTRSLQSTVASLGTFLPRSLPEQDSNLYH